MANNYERYQAKAISYDWAESQKKQTPYVSVIMETVATPKDPPQQFEWQGYFTDMTMERTIKSLKLLGCTFPGANIKDLTGYNQNVVNIQVEDGEYGKRVAWINPPGSVSDANRLSGAALDAFSQRMKGTVMALGGASGGGAKPATKVADPFASRPRSAVPIEWDGQGADPNGGRSYVRTPFDNDAAHDGRDPATGAHTEAPSEPDEGRGQQDDTPF